MIVASLARGLVRVGLIGVAMVPMGCGLVTLSRQTFPDQVVGSDNNPLFVSDLLDILADDDLSDAEKADAVGDLGYSNEEIIDALVRDGLANSFSGVADEDEDGN